MNVIAVLSRFTRNSTIGALKQIQVTVFSQRSLTGQTDKTDPKSKTDSTNQKNDSKSSRSSNATEEPPNDQQYDENVRRTILSASLPYVLELGWSKEALVKGAESLGYPGVSHGLFPRGGAELVQYFYTDCNQKLAVKLKKDVEECKKIVPSVFIQGAVQTRLRMIVPYLSRWPQAIAIMSLPPNVPHTLANLLTLVDDICYYAGDRSVDFTWYSRRIALGGVYKASELYLIQDKSEDNKDTWEFVTRRLDELFQIQTLISQSDNFTEHAKESITSAFITARNILGINWNR